MDDTLIKRGHGLAIQYARHLESLERYRDLSIVSAALLQLIDRDKYPAEWARLAGITASGLRMVGKREEAIKYCKWSLEAGESHLGNDEKAEIWLDVALAQESLENSAESVAAAEKIKLYSGEKSVRYLHALAVIAGMTLKDDDKKRELAALEKRARERGFETLANNIALDLASDTDVPPDELNHLDRVLATKERGYNHVRAIVAKAKAIGKLDNPRTLNQQEVSSLAAAYSYLHAQRFGSLLDDCHRLLWRMFEKEKDESKLLRLFRHSSFVWRIRGDEAEESKYLKRLSKLDVQLSATKVLLAEVSYFVKRLKACLPQLTTSETKNTAQSG
jgi:hypothetical protein